MNKSLKNNCRFSSMPDTLELVSSSRQIQAQPHLPTSKSISNRLLVIEAVSERAIQVAQLSDADDTRRLSSICRNLPQQADAGHGGTTFRFALCLLAATPGYQGVLTGSARLCERPQKALIDALRKLGADIECLEKEGFAPVSIKGKELQGGSLPIDAGISSQFLSALLLIAPRMQNGLRLIPNGDLVSPGYLNMTLHLLEKAGATVERDDHSIFVGPGTWIPQVIEVEPDWSAASYWYAFTALSAKASVFLKGLRFSGLQPDEVCAEAFRSLGVESEPEVDGVRLRKSWTVVSCFAWDGKESPDIIQTLACSCAGLGIPAVFTGLKTLRMKETDRLSALQNELKKIKVKVEVEGDELMRIDPSDADYSRTLIAETYHDHRMAMAFAPLVLRCYRVAIRNPEVVNKSYPGFWRDVREAGVQFAELEG